MSEENRKKISEENEGWVKANRYRLKKEIEEHEPQSAEEWAAVFGLKLGKAYPALCAYDLFSDGQEVEIIDDTLRFIRYDPDEKTLLAWSAQWYTLLLINNPLIQGGVVHYNDYRLYACMTKANAKAWDEMTRERMAVKNHIRASGWGK